MNDVLIGFDSNPGTILLLIDLSAAFDTVDIAKLLDILEKDIGITGFALMWFKSFLTGRTQQLKNAHTINGCIFSDGSCIRFANFVKNLGYILDKYLYMDIHVNSIVSLCYKYSCRSNQALGEMGVTLMFEFQEM